MLYQVRTPFLSFDVMCCTCTLSYTLPGTVSWHRYVATTRCVAAEIERVSLIEAGELDEDAATHDPVPAITKVGPYLHTSAFIPVHSYQYIHTGTFIPIHSYQYIHTYIHTSTLQFTSTI